MSRHCSSRSRSLVALLVIGSTLPACTARTPPAAHPAAGREITAAQISRLSGFNAWEVIRQSGMPLSVMSDGMPGTSMVVRRGVGSLAHDEAPLLLVDGIRMAGLDALVQIPREEIARIVLLSAIDASVRYGTGAAGGAIVIDTKQGR